MDMFGSFGIGGSLPNGLNFGFIMIAVVIAGAGMMFFLMTMKKRKDDALLFLVDQAKQKDLPVVVPIDLAGHGEAYLGTFEEPTDVNFKGTPFGLQIRPSLLEKAYPVQLFGVRWYFYFGNMYFPANMRDAFTLSSVMKEFREMFPKASFINDDLEIIHMLCIDEGDDLKYNCGVVVKEFEQNEFLMDDNGEPIQETEIQEEEQLDDEGEVVYDDEGNPVMVSVEVPLYDDAGKPVYKLNPDKVTDTELYDMIKKAKEKIFRKKIRTGFMHVKEAVSLIPFSMDGLVMDRIVKITEQKMEAKMGKGGLPGWGLALIVVAAIFGVVILGAFLVKTLFPVASSVV